MNDKPKRNRFAEALERGDVGAIATILADRDFTILEVELEPGSDDRGGMTAEVDGFPVVVAFTSQKSAGVFLEQIGDELELIEDGSATAFVVKGTSLFETLPAGFGLLLNPESDKTYVLEPELAERVKDAVAEL